MKELWADFGKLLFWVNWPFLYLYLRSSERTRLLVVAEGKVLVTRGWLGTGEWGLPGGGLHRKETPLAGVLRELHEETGIRIKPQKVRKIGKALANENGLKFRYHQFFAKLPEAVPVRVRSFEIVDVAWVPIKDLTEQNADQTALDTMSEWLAR